MGALKKLAVVLAIVIIILVIIGIYLLQYKNLEVSVDESQSGLNYTLGDEAELRVVLRFENTGSVDLIVPPTTFDVYVDGIFAGPGKSRGITVPAGAQERVTSTVDINRVTTPAAFLALVDPDEDTIRIKGEAHVEVGPFTLDFPFDESFKVDP